MLIPVASRSYLVDLGALKMVRSSIMQLNNLLRFDKQLDRALISFKSVVLCICHGNYTLVLAVTITTAEKIPVATKIVTVLQSTGASWFSEQLSDLSESHQGSLSEVTSLLYLTAIPVPTGMSPTWQVNFPSSCFVAGPVLSYFNPLLDRNNKSPL
jgi:hypothetical protein